jgi:hypothetical protein
MGHAVFASGIFQVKSAIENSPVCHLLSTYYRHCTAELLDRTLRGSGCDPLLTISDTSLYLCS